MRSNARLLPVFGVLLLLVGLTAAPSGAQPAPDPYGSTPRPDPAPAVSARPPAAAAAPDTAVQSSSTPAPRPAAARERRPARTVPPSTPVRRGPADLRAVVHRVGESTRRITAAAAADEGRSAILAALALLTLALAGGSVAHLVARSGGQWRGA